MPTKRPTDKRPAVVVRAASRAHRDDRRALQLLTLLLCLLTAVALLWLPSRAAGLPSDATVSQAPEEAEAEIAIPGGAVKPGRNARIVMPRADDPSQRVTGKVAWFTREKLGYINKDKTLSEVAWSDLSPEHLPRFLPNLPDRRDVEALLLTSELLVDFNAGEKPVERLLGYALKADASAKPRIEAIRERMNNGGGPTAGGTEKGGNEAGEARGADGQPEIDNPRAWPKLTGEQHAAAVQALRDRTDNVLSKMGHKMGSTETDRFLVYSDMSKKDSQYWVSVLDKMYDRLCKTFDLDKTTNIWKGKCLLLFFQSERDYLTYNMAAYGNNAQGSAGICYQFGSGDVHIAMFQQRDKKDLAHVLVHEAVHGFLFRYQSSHYIPNWLNEGLAEFIAVRLVDSGEYPNRAEMSRQLVKQRRSLDNFLSARNIIGPHYGLAFDVTALMVDENRKGYVKLIQGIKAGMTVEEAFEEEYGASIDRVFQYYAKSRLRLDSIRMR